MSKANSYLYLSRHNIYYLRVIIPINDTGIVTTKEYRKSLQTRDPVIAQKRSVALRACLGDLYNGQRCVMVGWSDLQKILDQKLLQLIAIEKEYVEKNGPRSPAIEKIWNQEDLPFYQSEINSIFNASDDVDVPLFVSGSKAEEILKKNGVDLEDSPELFSKFCISVLQMLIEYNSQRIDINNAARTYAPHSSTIISAIKSPPIITHEPSDLLSIVIEEFCDEKVKEKEKSWSLGTELKNRATFKTFFEVVQDTPIANITSATARRYKKELQRLPKNRNKRAEYREKTIEQILVMKTPDQHLLSTSKQNSHLGLMSSFFKWAVIHGYAERNLFTGLGRKDKKPDQDKRLTFNETDLQSLFTTPVFQEGERKHPYLLRVKLLS